MQPHHRDEVWSVSVCQTFFALPVGAHIPSIVSSPFSTCGCKNFTSMHSVILVSHNTDTFNRKCREHTYGSRTPCDGSGTRWITQPELVFGRCRVPDFLQPSPRRAVCQYIETLAYRWPYRLSPDILSCASKATTLMVWVSVRVPGAGRFEHHSNGGCWAQRICRGQSSNRGVIERAEPVLLWQGALLNTKMQISRFHLKS